MPTLIIDNRSVTVPEGTSVLEAAKRLGIVVPHFCYHEALGAVGACRLCAMKFLEGPIKGIQMSCMVEAKDDMVISTLDDEVQAYRSQVIEWLMTNHPHDCPVCDEGGECQLQDMTIAGGHGVRRYTGRKRTYINQDLGPFVVQEMNRCIQCYRCVRTYQDYCGGTDFGVLGVNQRLYFGRFKEGALESPFAGNLVDVCPTGALTDRTYRFKTRFWDLEEAPSVCPHCSLGCAVIPGVRYRELQRVRAGVNREVNGWFICDRGRYGYGYADNPDRPRIPRLAGEEVSWEAALDALRARLGGLIARHGAAGIALLGSGRASLEANFLLHRWSERLGCGHPAGNAHPARDRAARAAVHAERSASLADIRNSDLVVVFGADPLAEGPVLALALRQATRNGGRVVILDPRPVQLPCTFRHVPSRPEELSQLIKNLGGNRESDLPADLQQLAADLQQAERPVLVGGGDLLGAEGIRLLLAAARELSPGERACRTFVLLAEANSYGAALLGGSAPTFDQLLTGMEEGRIRALVCLEADPLGDCPRPQRLARAFERLDFLAVLDYLPTKTARQADLLLPTATPAESAGTLINNEGRMQQLEAVFQPGLPIRITGDGNHPPRVFSPDTPGGLPRPAWSVLAELAGCPGELAGIRRQIVGHDRRFAGLESLTADFQGRRTASGGEIPDGSTQIAAEPSGDLQLLACTSLYGSEPLSRLSAGLAPVMPEPRALLHRTTGEALGLADGDMVRLTTAGQQVTVPVRLCDNMADRLVVISQLRGTALERFPAGTGPIPCSVEKANPS
jgi:NADH-quinone oxidoreductase subunit G